MIWFRNANELLAASTLCLAVTAVSSRVAAQPATGIAFANRTVLVGAEGVLTGKITQMNLGEGKVGWIKSWSGSGDSVAWTATVERAGNYEISAILESSGDGCAIRIALDKRTLNADCGKKGWTREQVGTVRLLAGPHKISLTSSGATPPSKFFSLEFVTPQVRSELASRGRKQNVDTGWMIAAGYGLMFHWTSQTVPRQGPPQSYCDSVRNFDVERFADTVSQMGAGFVVFTTSHAGFYFPGPNPVIDNILPGRTCSRDLVGDLADALNHRNIRLELYFHPGHDDAPWWQRTHFNDDKSAYFRQWCAIVSAMGIRYGKRLAGFWFDDAAFTYYPFNPPWEQMTAAARAGNPDRAIAYNSWILPKLNDFYDVFAGENPSWKTTYEDLDYLPAGGTGRFAGGPQEGLQAEVLPIINGDWGHFKIDQPIAPPRLSADAIVPMLKDALSRKEVPLLDVEVYQDGTISPETFQLFQTIRHAIRPAPNLP